MFQNVQFVQMFLIVIYHEEEWFSKQQYHCKCFKIKSESLGKLIYNSDV